MFRSGILNPQLLSLLGRTRHTNTLVIADRGFPSWPGLETLDLSVTDDIPRIADVLRAVLQNWNCGAIYMAEEYEAQNDPGVLAELKLVTGVIPISWEPHVRFKTRVPSAIGLIRTGDVIPYANMILESA